MTPEGFSALHRLGAIRWGQSADCKVRGERSPRTAAGCPLCNGVAIQRYGAATVVHRVRAMATFHPTPFDALTASAKDLPASLNAASNACGHRAPLISAISVADISGDNARWAAWRAIALRQPAGPIAPTARIGAAPSAIVVARCRDVCQRVERCAPGIAFDLESERRRQLATGTNRVGSLAGGARGGCFAIRPRGRR